MYVDLTKTVTEHLAQNKHHLHFTSHWTSSKMTHFMVVFKWWLGNVPALGGKQNTSTKRALEEITILWITFWKLSTCPLCIQIINVLHLKPAGQDCRSVLPDFNSFFRAPLCFLRMKMLQSHSIKPFKTTNNYMSWKHFLKSEGGPSKLSKSTHK